jgi:hypothetical protein
MRCAAVLVQYCIDKERVEEGSMYLQFDPHSDSLYSFIHFVQHPPASVNSKVRTVRLE